MPQSQLQLDFYEQIVQADDISWKELILEAVKTNQMDPWDVDISFIATTFLAQLKELNFKVSGKIVLASALLLKLKSERFVESDMSIFDQLIAATQDETYDTFDEDEVIEHESLHSTIQVLAENGETLRLSRRTPQPRKRKVSVYDLIKALERALGTSKRREIRRIVNAPQVVVPKKTVDIISSMQTVFDSVTSYYSQNPYQPLMFSQLVPSTQKEDLILTFVPLLHLRNQDRVDLFQQDHFGDFHIQLQSAKKEIAQELEE